MLELKLKKSDLKKLMQIMHECLSANSHDDILKIIDLLNEVIPFNAAIICRNNTQNDDAVLSEMVNHSYPVDWMKSYSRNKLFLLDPVAIESTQMTKPFTWQEAYNNAEDTSALRQFINEAEAFGLKEGLTYSYNTSQTETAATLISLETSKHQVGAEYFAIVEYILPHLHEAVTRLYGTNRELEVLPEFTIREKETLKWAYEGKTAWEIGVILSISERTVKFHLNNIYQKLNVANRSQAVAKAIRHGIV